MDRDVSEDAIRSDTRAYRIAAEAHPAQQRPCLFIILWTLEMMNLRPFLQSRPSASLSPSSVRSDVSNVGDAMDTGNERWQPEAGSDNEPRVWKSMVYRCDHNSDSHSFRVLHLYNSGVDLTAEVGYILESVIDIHVVSVDGPNAEKARLIGTATYKDTFTKTEYRTKYRTATKTKSQSVDFAIQDAMNSKAVHHP
ncbi:hypothetical protein EDD11_010281 [Mortierella claussenii]|nr:hypothetical protein EDD11_010281 [Mortierella claussenii]